MAGPVIAHAAWAHGRASVAALALLLSPAWATALGPAQPFQPPAPVSPLGKASDPQPAAAGLTGVRLGTAPAALIDGTWVPLGQTARGARVAEVHPQHVLLLHPGGRAERLVIAMDEAPGPEAVPLPNRLVLKRTRP